MHKKHFFIIFVVFVVAIFFILLWHDNIVNRSKSESITVTSNYKNEIVLKDIVPMSDITGRSISFSEDNSDVQGYYEFEVTANPKYKTKFEIYAIEQYYDSKIHPNYIKVYLTDEYNNPISGYDDLSVPTFYNLKASSLNSVGKRLYYGSLKAGESKKFILRAWVGDAYSIGKTEKNFGMKIYVDVEG